jgi:hemerythrin superfamily protein
VDVLTLLKQDHETVSALLDEAEGCEPGDARLEALAEEIERALTVHAAIEEQYFYPKLRERSEETEETVDVFEAFTEHAVVKMLIDLLRGRHRDDEKFKAEVQVLAENVRHHVREEESTIFTLARDVFDQQELDQLGEKMERRKMRLMEQEQNGGRKSSGRKTSGRKTSGRNTSSRRKTSGRKSSGRKTAGKSAGRKTSGRKTRKRTRS